MAWLAAGKDLGVASLQGEQSDGLKLCVVQGGWCSPPDGRQSRMHSKTEADSLQVHRVLGRSLSNVQCLLVVYNSFSGMQCAAQAAAQEAEHLQQQEEALQQKISRAEEQMAQAAQASNKLEEVEQVCCTDMLIKLPDQVPLYGILTRVWS